MIQELFAAVIYLPIIVVCMIISQIYFERYWVPHEKTNQNNYWLILAIIVTYFLQEFCLLQLSMINIHEISFTLVVALTMLFRENVYRIWWWLLGLTPIAVDWITYYDREFPLYFWWHGIVQAIIFLAICWLLFQWHPKNHRYRYYVAMVCLGLYELVSLGVMHQLTPMTAVGPTLGLLVLVLLEERRHISELKNLQKIQALQRQSERDDLTGLLNYRALNEEVTKLREDRKIHQIVIGALDIDHFKHVNDTYGHFVGNEVLNYFSTVLRKKIHTAFPHHGYVYRFWGEEFSIVVSNYSLTDVYHVLQAIESDFKKTPIVTKKGLKITISFSCSLTNRVKNEALNETLRRADKMLYSAKNNGRGWIVTDDNIKDHPIK